MTAGRLASRANAMPAEDERCRRLRGSVGYEGHRVGRGRIGLAEGGPLTLWDLDGSTTEAPKQVGNKVVFDLILGEPGEHREQPKHHGFDLGRGASGEKRAYFQSALLSLGA